MSHVDKHGHPQGRVHAVASRPVRIELDALERIEGEGADIRINLGWDDSWREVPEIAEGTNWDAVWLFAKYKVDRHFRLPREAADRFWESLQTGSFLEVRQALERGAHVPEISRDIGSLELEFSFEWIVDGDVGKLVIRSRDEFGKTRRSEDSPFLTIARHSSGGANDVSFDLLDERSHWQHVNLSHDRGRHQSTDGCVIVPVSDGRGVFVHRDQDNTGQGAVSFPGLVLRWETDVLKRTDDVSKTVRLWIHGLNMVYVASGAYWLGDEEGDSRAPGCFCRGEKGTGPYQVTSSGPIKSTASDPVAGLGWRDREDTTLGDLREQFPNAYDAFYVLRGHVSQGEYADFINSLRGDAITLHYPYIGEDSHRFTIYKGKTRTRVASRPLRACNFFAWFDARAYLWWAGLRPMTELEFEKACRGPKAPVSHEYAWGTTHLQQAQVIVGDEATGLEILDGNCHVDNSGLTLRGGDGHNGPVRCGAFAGPGKLNAEWLHPQGRAVFTREGSSPTMTRKVPDYRELAGLSHWGIQTLSGNLWEMVVSVSREAGRAYEGEHGGGDLNVNGEILLKDSCTCTWPKSNAHGLGFRGGAFYTGKDRARVADRHYGMGLEGFAGRSHDVGCRGVRAAPEGDG